MTIFYAIWLALSQYSQAGPNLVQRYAHFLDSLTAAIPKATTPSNRKDLLRMMVRDTMQPYRWVLRSFYLLQPDLATNAQNFIVGVAMLQCPLHIYYIFALRASNESHLEAGGTEREWGFGQIVAIVLLGSNILPIADGITGRSSPLAEAITYRGKVLSKTTANIPRKRGHVCHLIQMWNLHCKI